MEPSTVNVRATPKDFFLYLAAIATLYISTASILRLLFEIINILFPDPLTSFRDPYSTSIRLSIASLIIIFPVYLFISWYLGRSLKAEPTKRELGIRKWLIYLTLFIAGAIIIGDLIALINTFLGGEITTRFILKVISILVVTGAIFGYYGVDLKKSGGVSPVGAKTFASVVSAFVLISIVGGFIVMGSPATIRKIKFDQTRVYHLQDIQSQTLNYWQQKRVLPNTLTELNNPLANYTVPNDPSTNTSYTYEKTGDLSFRLCATFEAQSTDSENYARELYLKGLDGSNNWQHGTGEICFDRTIDPALYPIRP